MVTMGEGEAEELGPANEPSSQQVHLAYMTACVYLILFCDCCYIYLMFSLHLLHYLLCFIFTKGQKVYSGTDLRISGFCEVCSL